MGEKTKQSCLVAGGGNSMRNNRDFTRAMNAPHIVTLYRNGRVVGNFTIPRTDTRFVKDDGLIALAFQAALNRTGTRYNDIPSWDMLSVFWSGMSIKCDKQGRRIHDA